VFSKKSNVNNFFKSKSLTFICFYNFICYLTLYNTFFNRIKRKFVLLIFKFFNNLNLKNLYFFFIQNYLFCFNWLALKKFNIFYLSLVFYFNQFKFLNNLILKNSIIFSYTGLVNNNFSFSFKFNKIKNILIFFSHLKKNFFFKYTISHFFFFKNYFFFFF